MIWCILKEVHENYNDCEYMYLHKIQFYYTISKLGHKGQWSRSYLDMFYIPTLKQIVHVMNNVGFLVPLQFYM